MLPDVEEAGMDDRIYTEAAEIVGKIINKESSIRSLVFGSTYKVWTDFKTVFLYLFVEITVFLQNKKGLYKLCCQTLKYGKVLDSILERSGIQPQSVAAGGNIHLTSVLLYDFLFGKKLVCSNKLRMGVERNAKGILAAKSALVTEGIIDADGKLIENQSEEIPRKSVLLPITVVLKCGLFVLFRGAEIRANQHDCYNIGGCD